MSLNPEARAMIAEVAASRAELTAAEAAHEAREAAHDIGITSARQHLGELYVDETGLVGSGNFAELARASLELEGTETYNAVRAGQRIDGFQSRAEAPGMMLAIGSDNISDRDIVAAFTGPAKHLSSFMEARPNTHYAGGVYEVNVGGGTPDFPVVSARTSQYGDKLGTGRFYTGSEGMVEDVNFRDLKVIGPFLFRNTPEMKLFEEATKHALNHSSRLHDAMLFDEHAVTYLSALLEADMFRGPVSETRQVRDDFPLVLIAKDIMGVDLSEDEARVAESPVFKERVMQAISGYAAEIATAAVPEDAPWRTGSPVYLHGRILDMVGLEAPEVETAVEEGALAAGNVLGDSDLETLAERIEGGKRRKIRDIVEPLVEDRAEKIRTGFEQVEPYTGLDVEADQLVASAFSDRDKFWRVTGRGIDFSLERDALYDYMIRAKSFRTQSQA